MGLEIAPSNRQGADLQCGEPVLAPTASLAASVYFSPIKAFKCERQRPGWRTTSLHRYGVRAQLSVTSLASNADTVCVCVCLACA